MKKITVVFLFFVLLISAAAIAENGATDGKVTRVLDAGIIEIDGHRMVLIGVEAPRRWWWAKPRDCFSTEAAAFLEDAVLNQAVSYSYDEEMGPHASRAMKRIYLFLGDRSMNEELISKGYALADHLSSYTEKEKYIKLEENAKFHQMGLWHACPVECYANKICRVKNW